MEFDYHFPEGFQWGVATASYQLEGGVREGGRGESIWDRFCSIPGNIREGANGDIACDHYHRWREDVQLMKRMGIKVYRFSVAWARIMPQGCGEVNQEGLKFYSDLVDELLANGIEPAITLYHWDLPQALQDQGGWTNRQCAQWFADFSRVVFEALADRVHMWITLNEPWVAGFGGYYYGQFAPGHCDFSAALEAVHNMLRGHGMVVRKFREMQLQGEIGITLNLCPREAYADCAADREAADRVDGFANRWFLDAVFKGTYPEDMRRYYLGKGVRLPKAMPEDMALISEKIDFIGVNYYNVEFPKENKADWPLEAEIRNHSDIYRITNFGVAIVERGLTDMLVRIDREYGHPRIWVTENGASFLDVKNVKGEVLDDCRIDYLERHIIACHKAIEQGVDLRGYIVWTLIDCFEWETGYTNTFGLVYMDRRTRDRTIKKSGMWYRTVIEKNGIY